MTAAEPNEMDVLRAFVEAHAQRHSNTGDREPIMFLLFAGGSAIQHHGFDEPPLGVDEAFLEEMHGKGLISIDYRQHSWHITPTEHGRATVEANQRIANREPTADRSGLVAAVETQQEASNPLAWPVVRPVLAALRTYWQESGFSHHGIQLLALYEPLRDEHGPVFTATIQTLIRGGYLEPTGELAAAITDDAGRVSQLPGEVALTSKAHEILDGWPGAAPEELVENLLAVIQAQAEQEPDPARKRRLQALAESVRELGVSLASEVLGRVITGAM